MDRKEKCSKINEAMANFRLEGTPISAVPYGSGHINDTFLVVCNREGQSDLRYILQRMNNEIFKNPEQLMENICGVTEFLRAKIVANGGNPNRETMTVIKTKNDQNYFVDSIKSYWRAYNFIVDAATYDKIERPEQFFESAVAFGNFQRLLCDYPAGSLSEAIPNFHNTKMRYDAFKVAIENDSMGRRTSVQNEIDFALAREAQASEIVDRLASGIIPLRVTHNDTKLNNVMLDDTTQKGVCVIDLDTVMPGSSLYDFGDSIRFGANTGAEDEIDLSKVNFSLELFQCYTKGFVQACDGSLTKIELDMLPMGAKLMTLECGVRFLTDYLSGDVYFKIHRPEHNLDRARTQFKLVADMEKSWSEMGAIVDKYR